MAGILLLAFTPYGVSTQVDEYNDCVTTSLVHYNLLSCPQNNYYTPVQADSLTNKGLLKGIVEYRSFLVYCLNLSFVLSVFVTTKYFM